LVFFKKRVDSGDTVKTQKLGPGAGRLLGVIIFCSIRFLSKKITKLKFFIKKNREQFKPIGFSFGLVFLDKNRFKLVWLGFFRVWISFFRFGSIFFFWFWVWFFLFQVYKTELNWSVFFKILIGFFIIIFFIFSL